MSPDGEVWKPLPGYEGRYLISSLGRIRGRHGRLIRDHMVKANHGSCLHRRVSLCGAGRIYKTFKVHRLVLKTFIGDCPAGMQGCHNNGKADDNRLVNLRWDTPVSNQADRVLHGTTLIGEKHPSAKLTDFQVMEIRKIGFSLTNAELCSRFSVSHSTISRVLNRDLWRHLP